LLILLQVKDGYCIDLLLDLSRHGICQQQVKYCGEGDVKMNENIMEFFSTFEFLIVFLVMCGILNMSIGEQGLFWFLLLVLFSMIIINYEKFANFLGTINQIIAQAGRV